MFIVCVWPLLALITAHAAPVTQISVAWPVSAGPVNPHLYTPNQLYAQSMIYEPLVKYQADGSVIPWLATAWQTSADGKIWRFTLRHDVTFSNGEPFNAAAVKANFDAILDNRARHAWLGLVQEIVAVKAPAPDKLEIVLKAPYYPLLAELALPRPFRFIAPSQFRKGGTRLGIAAPIGTGPWILSESKLNQYDVFVRNLHYWGKAPDLEKITVKVIPDPTSRAVALETGGVDLLYGDKGIISIDDYQRLSHNPAWKTRLSAPVETVMLALNTRQAPTNELAVRQAINHAVDKKTLLNAVFYGTQRQADTLFAPSVPYANLNLPPYRYDPTLAKKLLDDAGWQLSEGKNIREKNGQPLRVMLNFTGTDALSKSMAEVIQADLACVGISVQLAGEEESSIYARQRDGRFGMIFNQTWGGAYDPHAFLSSMRVPSHADYQAQLGLKDKPLIDREIGEILTSQDIERRQALYRDVLTRLHQQAVYLPLSYVSLMAVSNSKLGEIPFAPIPSEMPVNDIHPEPQP